MDIGFEGFGTAEFGDFDVDVEDVHVKKKRKYDRIWKVTFGGSVCGRPVLHKGMIIFSSLDNHVYALDFATRKEIWRFKASANIYSSAVVLDNVMFFSSMDCHVYALDADTGEEVWRFATSTLTISPLPPPYESFNLEVSKSSVIDEAEVKEKYKKRKEETVSLSDYHVTSEYHMESEYKQKGEYDTSSVMFEGVMECENIWSSDLKVLTSESRISM
jgi:hypothetical protein